MSAAGSHRAGRMGARTPPAAAGLARGGENRGGGVRDLRAKPLANPGYDAGAACVYGRGKGWEKGLL